MNTMTPPAPRDSSVLLGVGLGRRQQVNAERFERLRLIDENLAQFLVGHSGELVHSAVLKPVVETKEAWKEAWRPGERRVARPFHPGTIKAMLEGPAPAPGDA
jgi:hypothetical protein